MKYKTYPNKKMRKVAEKVLKNGLSVSKAMLEVGYSPATAKNPLNLTNSKGWSELMEDYLPDDELVNALRLLLDAEKKSSYLFPKGYADTTIKEIIEGIPCNRLLYVRQTKVNKIAYYSKPDYTARSKALDLCLKLKGRYSQKKLRVDQVTIVQVVE